MYNELYIYYSGYVIIYKIAIVRIFTGATPYVHVHAISYLALLNGKRERKK